MIVGLTGGIGSGKTTVANLFAQYGVPVVDTDVIAREVVAQGEPALQKIEEHFGSSITLTSGELNRKRLREIIFSNPTEKQWLESLLHPLIRERTRTALKKAEHESRVGYAILVSPLLLESPDAKLCERILIVDLPSAQQISRVVARDSVSEEQVNQAIATQIDRESRLAAAHDILDNSGPVEALAPQVLRLHTQYSEMAKQKS